MTDMMYKNMTVSSGVEKGELNATEVAREKEIIRNTLKNKTVDQMTQLQQQTLE